MGNSNISYDIRQAAKNGTPIRYRSLLIYPLQMKQYELLCACESALKIRLSMLPAALACRSYADMLYQVCIKGEDIVSNGKVVASVDDFSRFIALLEASLRLSPEERLEAFRPVVDTNTNSLVALFTRQFTEENGEAFENLTVADLSQIRQIIAELNGRTLPDESENAELAEADEEIRTQNGQSLDVNIDSLKASVARDQRVRIKEIEEWTIYEFELCRAAIDRQTRFLVYGIGEASGMVKFQKGNPFPSLFFDRPAESMAVVPVSELNAKFNGAIEQVDSLPNIPTITK